MTPGEAGRRDGLEAARAVVKQEHRRPTDENYTSQALLSGNANTRLQARLTREAEAAPGKDAA